MCGCEDEFVPFNFVKVGEKPCCGRPIWGPPVGKPQELDCSFEYTSDLQTYICVHHGGRLSTPLRCANSPLLEKSNAPEPIAEENRVTEHDPVNHPTHYASEAECSKCGESIECIDVVRHMKFSHGNAIKYLWRAGKKDATVQDLKKAIWYIEDMIAELEGRPNPNVHRLSKSDPVAQSIKNQASIREHIGQVVSSETTDKGFELRAKLTPEAMNEMKKPEGIVDAAWRNANPNLGVTIVNHPECEFEEPEELKHSFRFYCRTHKFNMYMAIDKAPEHCSKYESETE